MEYLQQNTNFKQILSIIEYAYMLKNINSSNNPITSFSRNVCNGTGEVWLKTQPTYKSQP